MRRALVIGASGYIGGALCVALRDAGWSVLATARRPDAANPISFDLETGDPETLPPCDVVYICAAMTGFRACRMEPERAFAINVDAPARIARVFAARRARVVFLSTAAALDCASPAMRSDHAGAGRSVYGRSKAAAERALLAIDPGATILRIAKVLKPGEPLVIGWIRTLREGGRVEAFSDQRIAPVAVGHVCAALAALGDMSDGGVYQLSGSRDIRYFDLALTLASMTGAAVDQVVACRAIEKGISEEETLSYNSMDCSRLTALAGFAPPDPAELVETMYGPATRAPAQRPTH